MSVQTTVNTPAEQKSFYDRALLERMTPQSGVVEVRSAPHHSSE